ncbi:glycosyltransferase family 4 protein [Thermopolyspora sp. NPDC052614]|uniref:glycosyltransferase family 4 protein n=1 Tax=Thermopolyspora sp. NPDC052614 TaxID=3155682 RepID=UPI00342AB915
MSEGVAAGGRPMRIVLGLGTSAGGVGRHVRMLCEGLSGRGHQVVVAGPRATEETFGFAGAGARFVEVPVSDRPHPARDVRAIARLRRVAAKADVVHAHGLRAAALAALALAASRTRLVVTLHNAPTSGGMIGGVFAGLEWIVARRADRVLVVSADLGERMRDRGAGDVAPAVVPAPALRPASRSPQEVRGELDAGLRPILLTVARLARQKGLETLLDAAAGPYDEDPLFVIAGGGPLEQDLRARIDREKLPVRLLGHRDDVPDLLQAADALVVSSRWEGQPLIVQEALRAGRPIIAAAVGGIPEMVGDAALLVPAEDAAALRDGVRRLLADSALAARLAQASARRGGALPGENEAVEAALRAYALPG